MEYFDLYDSNVEAYNNIFESWNEKRNYYWKAVKVFLEKIESKEKKLFIDVGCGNGRHIFLAESLGFKKENIYGIDISENQIKNLKEKNYNVFVLDMKRLSTIKKEFDVIVNIASFHHILNFNDQKKVLEEHYKILSDKGIFLLSVWNPQKSFVKKMLEKNKFEKISDKIYNVKYTFFKNFEKKTFNRYYYFFEKEELKNLLEEFFFIEDFYEEDHNLYFELKKR